MDAIIRLSDGAAARLSAQQSFPPIERPTSGVVLPYRQRTGPSEAKPRALRSVPTEACVVIHFAGRDFVTRESMAEVFLRRAGRVVADGASQLVPLLHENGLELLFVSPSSVVRVTRMAAEGQ